MRIMLLLSDQSIEKQRIEFIYIRAHKTRVRFPQISFKSTEKSHSNRNFYQHKII